MKFHHLGVVCKDIQKELNIWQYLGYKQESDFFIDEIQKIKGVFLTAQNQPRIELLQNNNGEILNNLLRKKTKIYHYAYETNNIKQELLNLQKQKAIVICPIVKSSYFEQICFVSLPNSLIIELVELKK
nr:VOC family protein [Campylobacter sp.]